MPYDQKSDIWSLGCIFAELFNYGRPILPGKNTEHQFELICANIGFPTIEDWPDFYARKAGDINRLDRYRFYKENKISENFSNLSDNGKDFLKKMFQWDPKVESFFKFYFRKGCQLVKLSYIRFCMKLLCQNTQIKSKH